jgi:hypothetical protein
MGSPRIRAWLALGVLVVLGTSGSVYGCARGEDDDLGPADAALPDEDGGGAMGRDGASRDSGGLVTGDDDDDDDSGTADGGSGEGGPPVGDAGACAPTTGATCNAAYDMGSVKGDDGTDRVTTTGSGARWVRVAVEESVGGLFTADLSVKVTLTSPTGSNFDVFVYEGDAVGTSGAINCNQVTKSGTSSTAQVDTVSFDWPDTQGLTGFDDGRTLSIEVRPVGASCDPIKTWTLAVEGHVP